MHIFKKLLSVILASTIVIGCGVIANAANDNDIEINMTNFPDTRFRSLIRQQIDKDHDGYISINERFGIDHMNLSDELPNKSNNYKRQYIMSLQGLNYLSLSRVTIIDCARLKEIDLSKNGNIKDLLVISCNSLVSFKGSSKITDLEFNWCPVFENLDLSNCTNLKNLTINNCEYQLDNLDLTHSPNLKRLTLSLVNYSSITFNSNARLEELSVQAPITHIDVSKVLDLKTTTSFTLSTEGKLTSLRVSPTVLNILNNCRTKIKSGRYEYRYSRNGNFICVT